MPSEFFLASQKIVENFLQTAVWIDDRAFERDKTPPATKVDSPKKRKTSSDEKMPATLIPPVAQAETEDETSHSADSKSVIDGFADRNIFCAVLDPNQNSIADINDKSYKLALAADIIIVDWSFQKDRGEHALKFISNIIKNSMEKKPGQLRLIIVYTGSSNLPEISEQIHETAVAAAGKKWECSEDNFCYVADGVRIVVLAKEGTSLLEQYDNRKTSFANLAQRSITEFTKITAGLVPNVVLYSMTQLRDNTHKLLRKFNKDFDAPYLTHRACLPDPSDAETHLVSLVASEIHSILEEFDAGKQVDIESIRRWLQREDAPSEFILEDKKVLQNDDVEFLLSSGFEKWQKKDHGGAYAKKYKEKAFRNFTRMFFGKEGDDSLDLTYAELNNFRSLYGSSLPYLKLGSLLWCDDSYILCIHPLCDCVRLQGSPRGFVFLALTPNYEKYNLVVKGLDGDYLRFKVTPKTKDCRIITFSPLPASGDIVKSKFDGESILFTDIHDKKYCWIGELRHDSAQKYANEFAAKLSRVGTNDYEWLRRIGEEKG